MMEGNFNSRIINPNMEVLFEGFHGTVYELGQSGWRVQADQNIIDNSLRMAFTHDTLNCVIVTNKIDFRYQEWHLGDMRKTYTSIQNMRFKGTMFPRNMTFEFQNIKPMAEVDFRQEVINTEIKSMDDFFVFKPKPAKEIILTKEMVPDMLGKILELQGPTQDELREKHRLKVASEIRNMRENKEAVSEIIPVAEIISI